MVIDWLLTLSCIAIAAGIWTDIFLYLRDLSPSARERRRRAEIEAFIQNDELEFEET